MSMRAGYTKEQFIAAVVNSLSYAQVCRTLGLRPVGGNYHTVKKKIKEYGLSTEHMTEQGWNTGKAYRKVVKAKTLEEILVNGVSYQSGRLRERLIEAGLKEARCESCGNMEWLGEPIPLELDHIDGDKFNNELNNLAVLCPNCHAKTPTYRGRNQKRYGRVAQVADAEDLKSLSKDSNLDAGSTPVSPTRMNYNQCKCGADKLIVSAVCKGCSNRERSTKIVWPSAEELLSLLETRSFVRLGKELGVSDNAIRKRLICKLDK